MSTPDDQRDAQVKIGKIISEKMSYFNFDMKKDKNNWYINETLVIHAEYSLGNKHCINIENNFKIPITI